MTQRKLMTGDFVEAAIWLSGTETEEQLNDWKLTVLGNKRIDFERDYEFEMSPWTFQTKKPGDERVPQVPKGVKGPDVRLLVATAKVGKKRPKIVIKQALPFAEDLTTKDRNTLRKITRDAWVKAHPGERLTDRNCDEVINNLGQEVIMKQLRALKQ